MSTDFLDNPFRPSNSVFEPDPWLDQFNQLWYDYFNERDPADDFDDFDRIEREQEANRLVDLIEAYDAGTIGYEQFMAEFNTGDTFNEIPGFDDWIKETRDAVQYDSMLNDWAIVSKSDDPQAIQDFVSLYNRTGIADNKLIQADLASTGSATAVITGTIDNSILDAAIKKAAMGDGILGGTVDLSKLPGYGGIWEGLIRHIEVMVKGLPLPIPDWLPLPGIFELPTIGEIFDTVTGPWKTASEDALRDCVATGKSASQCMEEQSVLDILVDGIGNATEGVWEATKDKVNEIFGEEGIIDRCTENPSGCAQEVFDKIKDIFGEGAVDPTATGGNIPDWLKVIIIGGAYGDEILGELEDLFGGDIDDDGTVGLVLEPEECGEGEADFGNGCEAVCEYDSNIPASSDQCVAPWQDDGPTAEQCREQNRSHVPGNAATETASTCGECLSGFDEVEGQCQEKEDPIENQGPTAQECADQNRDFNEATDVSDSSCGPCLEGFEEDSAGNCVATPTATCEDPNSSTFGQQGECGPCKSGFEKGSDGVCVESATQPQQGDPCKTEDGLDGTLQPVQELGFGPSSASGELECVPNQTEPTETGFDCNQPRPDGGFAAQSWDRYCAATRCLDGSIKDNPEGTNCPEYVAPEVEQPEEASPCDQQNRVTREDGSCGECKPGFTPDPEGFDQCIQAPPECNDCSCAEYASANPVECTQCPEGQSYCESTGQCEAEGNCPAAEQAEEGGSSLFGGGGFGGGGANLFEPYSFAVSADPTLLGSKQFPITDFLAGIFTNSTGGRNA